MDGPPPLPEEGTTRPVHTSAPPTTPYGTTAGGVVVPGVACVDCGYDLAGLHEHGKCPECGASIERSLKGDLLLHASPEYLASLHRGSVIVLTIILLQVLTIFATFGLAMASGLIQAVPTGWAWMDLVIVGVQFVLSAMLVWGWWLLSAPQPSLAEKPWVDKARRWVRYVLLANIALLAGQATVHAVMYAGFTQNALYITYIGLEIGSTLIWLAAYVVHAIYLGWLAKRIPDAAMHKRAKLLMWLCPLLSTVGIILIGLGPLIALVLYWNLIDRFRKAFKRVRAEQEALPGTAQPTS